MVNNDSTFNGLDLILDGSSLIDLKIDSITGIKIPKNIIPPTRTPTRTPTYTPTPSVTASISLTITRTPTSTVTSTRTATPTPTPTI